LNIYHPHLKKEMLALRKKYPAFWVDINRGLCYDKDGQALTSEEVATITIFVRDLYFRFSYLLGRQKNIILDAYSVEFDISITHPGLVRVCFSDS